MQRRDFARGRRALAIVTVGSAVAFGAFGAGCERDPSRRAAEMQAEQLKQNGERQAEQVRRLGEQQAEQLRQQAELVESRSRHEAERIEELAEDQARATRRHPGAMATPVVTTPTVNSPALTAPAPTPPAAYGGGPVIAPVRPAPVQNDRNW